MLGRETVGRPAVGPAVEPVGSGAVGSGAGQVGEGGQVARLLRRSERRRLGRTERTFASADDVAQEVCMAVLTALSSYRDQGRPFLAFVYGIAAHKVIDAHRAAGRNKSEPVPDVPDSAEVADGPEQRALQFESAGEMGRLLEVLPEKQREILILRVVNGL